MPDSTNKLLLYKLKTPISEIRLLNLLLNVKTYPTKLTYLLPPTENLNNKLLTYLKLLLKLMLESKTSKDRLLPLLLITKDLTNKYMI